MNTTVNGKKDESRVLRLVSCDICILWLCTSAPSARVTHVDRALITQISHGLHVAVVSGTSLHSIAIEISNFALSTDHYLPRVDRSRYVEESTARRTHTGHTAYVTARDTHIGEVCGMGGTPRPVFARQLCATASLHLAPTFNVHGHTQAV